MRRTMPTIRVAHVVTTLDLGGAQLVAVDLVRRLRARGYETFLLAGSEGALRSEAWASNDPSVRILPRLKRRIAPLSDLITLVQLVRFFRSQATGRDAANDGVQVIPPGLPIVLQ